MLRGRKWRYVLYVNPLALLTWLFKGVGTQESSHYLFSNGLRLPLNARETGLFLGILLALAVYSFTGTWRTVALASRGSRYLLLVGAILSALDGVHALLGSPLYSQTVAVRFWFGLGLGLCGTLFIHPLWNQIRGERDLIENPANQPADLVGAVGIPLGVALLAVWSLDLSVWPLAVLSTIGFFVSGGVFFWLPLSQTRLRHAPRWAQLAAAEGLTTAALLLAARLS